MPMPRDLQSLAQGNQCRGIGRRDGWFGMYRSSGNQQSRSSQGRSFQKMTSMDFHGRFSYSRFKII